MRCTKQRILELLASREGRQLRDEKSAPAAVLLLLFEKEGICHILFTKRSNRVKQHKGEISFPGGTVDPGDLGLLHTALREGAEEIGVEPQDVTVLGRLDDIFTLTTGFIITPYVGLIPYPYEFRINTDEISELIFLPLPELVEDDCVQTAQVTHFRFRDHIIWGATARILKQFIDLICEEER